MYFLKKKNRSLAVLDEPIDAGRHGSYIQHAYMYVYANISARTHGQWTYALTEDILSMYIILHTEDVLSTDIKAHGDGSHAHRPRPRPRV